MRALSIACAAFLLTACGPTEDEQYVADELGISTEEASELIAQYGDPADAIDDYRDANEINSYAEAGEDDFERFGQVSNYGDYGDERAEFDEDAARAEAERQLANEGYNYAYGCTEDCSGHDAGWEWRAQNGYSTYGDSQSFEEGGRAFDEALESRVEEMRDDYEAGNDYAY